MPGYTNHILIVDDNANARELLYDLLRDQPYKLHQAATGKAGLRAIQRYDPDLVLLDVMMPEMDGFEVCHTVRNDPKMADIPVILLTALNDQESRLRGFEAGADDFISKPYDRVELRTRIRGITRLNRYRRLVAEETKFKAVVNHSQQATVIIGDDGKLQYANHAAEQLLQVKMDSETIGADFLALVQQRYRLEPHLNWGRWPRWQNDPTRKRFLVSRDDASAEKQWLRVDMLAHVPQQDEMIWVIHIVDATERVAARRELWTVRQLLSQRLMPQVADLVMALEHLAYAGDSGETSPRIAMLSLQKARDLHQRLEKAVKHSVLVESAERQFTPISQIGFSAMTARQNALHLMLGDGGAIEIRDEVTSLRGYVPCSSEQLQVMLAELLENAIFHHPSNAPRIDITIAAREDAITLAVADDGIGMSDDELDSVWKPYYQAKGSATPGKSLGLGLTIVSTILWEVGGHLSLRVRPEKAGVIATLHLPRVSKS